MERVGRETLSSAASERSTPTKTVTAMSSAASRVFLARFSLSGVSEEPRSMLVSECQDLERSF